MFIHIYTSELIIILSGRQNYHIRSTYPTFASVLFRYIKECFSLFVFLPFCIFAFLSFCLFVFLSLSFCHHYHSHGVHIYYHTKFCSNPTIFKFYHTFYHKFYHKFYCKQLPLPPNLQSKMPKSMDGINSLPKSIILLMFLN